MMTCTRQRGTVSGRVVATLRRTFFLDAIVGGVVGVERNGAIDRRLSFGDDDESAGRDRAGARQQRFCNSAEGSEECATSRNSPGNWEAIVLRGTIIETSLDSVPSYYALSYCWGDASLSEVIFLDGRPLRITQSCADALRRMIKGKLERTIWVDSICDEVAVQERSTQVAVMDEIYSKAIQVNVHLGSGDEKTEAAIEAVRSLAVASSLALEAKRLGVGEERTRRKYDKIVDEVLQVSPEFPYGKLHPLFRLHWFRRVWVFQEVALARLVVFYCGNHLLRFENLVAAADFTQVPYSKLDVQAIHWKSYLLGHAATIRCLQLREQGELVELEHMALFTILSMLEATRPEDKIYGMYGCAKRLGLNWPVPDYTKSVAQIYTEATIACLQQSQSLAVLSMAVGPATGPLGLPSWVPDFSSCLKTFSPSNPPTLALEAGKHVLVEKPITVNVAQARVLYALAREKNRFLMEAVWTRFFPLTRSVQEFIAAGRLGTVKRVHADLSFWNDVEAEFGTAHRMVNTKLAGGALLDLGVYSLTWVFLVLYHLQAGAKRAPKVVGAMSKYPATGCDEMTSVVLDFCGAQVGSADGAKDTGDAHAVALTNIRVAHDPNPDHPSPDPVRIQGTLGDISIASPSYRPLSYTLIPAQSANRGSPADFKLERKIFEVPAGHGMFWEADECARCVRDGRIESEVMGWEESVKVMEVMDEVRRQGGLVYPEGIESVEYPLAGFGL
ncbi:hypothetical protein OPT61_g7776 [Boeremia exigua]|uniref:Uncharacterized protein n=1 Tax=Boeremia exigua TaxID=749465 RepID=A0ACC2I214_9PLEO|nr:hypothetical protein OPT61_g7776 [Boeremia exigua]